MKAVLQFIPQVLVFFFFLQLKNVFPSSVVLPPFFKLDEDNQIIFVNDQLKNAKITIEPLGISQNLSGELNTVKFHIGPEAPKSANVKITLDGKVILEKNIGIRSDLFNVHIHIDKPVYRNSEILNARILPLTEAGKVYTGELEVFLINSKGFVENSTMKTVRASEETPIISEMIYIPAITDFGDWNIRVRPITRNYENFLTFEQEFQVQEYELPIFRLAAFLTDGSDIGDTVISVEAKYFHGKPVNGPVYIYCREVNSSSHDRSHLIHVKSGEFSDGIWSNGVDLTKCEPFKSDKEIYIEARENGTGRRQELVLAWDIMEPKFNLVPVRPYFTNETNSVILFIDSAGATGIVDIILRCIYDDQLDTRQIQTNGTIDGVVKIEIPFEWRVKEIPVIRVIAKRKLSHGWSNSSMLYIPNLSNTFLKANLVEFEKVQTHYKPNEVMKVHVDDHLKNERKLYFFVVCNSRTVHHVKENIHNSILSIFINHQMEGTCVLVAFAADKSATDVILFRVQNECKDCSLTVSRRNNGISDPLTESSVIEPGDLLDLEFQGEQNSIVFYRAIDDRLNHIILRNYVSNTYQDYVLFGKELTRAQVFNLVNHENIEREIRNVCRNAGYILHHNCEQGKRATSVVSEKCLQHVLYRCFKNASATALMVKNPNAKPRPIELEPMKTAASTNMLDIFRPRNFIRVSSISSEHPMEYHDAEIVKPKTRIRQFFPETWLFDALVLPQNGTHTIQVQSPDNVGLWAISCAFWKRRRLSLIPVQTKYLQSRKYVFLELETPRNAYVNETINLLIRVVSIKAKKSKSTLVMCLSELPRKVCADQGVNGMKGDPYYTKVEMTKETPIQSKLMMMKFLSSGMFNITVSLKENKCDGGKVIDIVRKQVEIKKRADTEEYYGRHILNANKPLVTAMNDDPGEPPRSHKMITFSDQRNYGDSANTIHTLVTSNVPDTETVYLFSVTLSKFLSPADQNLGGSTGNRIKRNGNRMLTSVIKDLSVTLYEFKRIKLKGDAPYSLEIEINNLVNEMMHFSNCTSVKEPCAYSEFGKPQTDEDVSILLTSIATSLLCEADVEEARVLGSLKTIMYYIPRLGEKHFNIDMSDIIDVEDAQDKKFLLASFMFQVSRDCANYRNGLKDMTKSFGKLHKYFYDLDESNVADERTAGAIAFMASNATAELMRSDLLSKIDKNNLPYWKCNNFETGCNRSPSCIEPFRRRRRDNCQVMFNSFVLSAVLTAYAEGTQVNWDLLADWINEQQQRDGSFGSPLTTLIAKRSLYEKSRRMIEIDYNEQMIVNISYKGIASKQITITNNPIDIHIPSNVRYLTLTTIGRGSAVVAVKIIATRRPRPKRGLSQDDYFPVHFNTEQQIVDNYIHQTVCFNVTKPNMITLEIFHGAYTLYEASPDKLDFLNSSHIPINPSTSSLGLHFIVTNIKVNETICYKTVLTESSYGRLYPAKSSPVPIQAFHPVHGLVGMILIAHPDVPKTNFIRRHRRKSARTRFIRRIIDESAVDTVCYDGGECACAETTCNVQCNQCGFDQLSILNKRLSETGIFGIRFQIIQITQEIINDVKYFVFDSIVKDSRGNGAEDFQQKQINTKIRIWMRNCNFNCQSDSIVVNGVYLVIGHKDGLNYDANGRMNYVLNHLDRFERNSEECTHMNSALTISL